MTWTIQSESSPLCTVWWLCCVVFCWLCVVLMWLCVVLCCVLCGMWVQLFGCGSVAQVTTSENKNGQYLSINLGFALGTTFGIYVSRGVSGTSWEIISILEMNWNQLTRKTSLLSLNFVFVFSNQMNKYVTVMNNMCYCSKVPIWTLLWLSVCASWAGIPGSTCPSMCSPRCWGVFWVQPLLPCSTTVLNRSKLFLTSLQVYSQMSGW